MVINVINNALFPKSQEIYYLKVNFYEKFLEAEGVERCEGKRFGFNDKVFVKCLLLKDIWKLGN